jgi:pimeloyl-ACP methyl ester carboxylesterase
MSSGEHWTVRSGPRIRYLDNAPVQPIGLPVLFSPGLSDFADEYFEMLDFFSPRRVLVIEVRGRGRSEAPAAGYTVADHVADLNAVLEEEEIGRFHLMTFSRGTSWGLELAHDAPQRVASISIGDYRAVEVALPPEFAESQLRSRFRGKLMSDRLSRHVLERLAADSTGRELWDELRSLPCPLLVAHAAGHRGILTDEFIARYREARPDVEVVAVPEAPHDLFHPDPLYYPKAVAEFIDRRCSGL